MANKKVSPFLSTQNQTIAVIKQVNKDIKPCLSELKKKIVDADARKKLKEICLNELDKVYEQKKIIESLKEEDEPKQITKFDVKVAQELTKINNLEAHLKTVAEKLLPTPNDDEKVETPEGGDRRISTKLISKSGKDGEQTGAEDEEPTAPSSDQGLTGKLMEGETSNTLKSNVDNEASRNDIDKAKDGDDGNKYEDDNDDDDDEDEEEDEDEVKKSNLDKRPLVVASRPETNSKKVPGSKITGKVGQDAVLNEGKQINEGKQLNKGKPSGITDDDDERQDDVSKNDDDDDDDDDEEETGMDQKELTIENVDEYVALETFEGQEEGDLPFQKGDVLKIKVKRSDGWMLAVDEKGREGLVPANFLKPSSETGLRKIDDADDDRRKEEEIYEDDDDDDDKVGEIKSDEEVNGEDADNDAENKEDDTKFKQINKSGKSLASQLKRSQAHMSKDEQRELIDRLSNVPSGYRLSTLAKFKSEAPYSLKYVLHPKLSRSGLIYRDLLMLPVTNEILSTRCRFQSIIKLLSIRNIPLPNSQSGMQCLEGFVRICLFDGQKLLSNISTIKVQKLDVNASEWKFGNQSSASCMECAELFLKSNSTSLSIGLLCEFTLLLATDFGTLEMSCGWSFIKLLGDDGSLIANKTYRLPVNGGSPFEKGVPLDRGSSLSLAAASKFSLSNKSKGPPMISIKMISPTKMQTRYIECLPEPVIGPTCHLAFFFYLRHIMLDIQVRFRTHLHSTESVHSPLLSSFLDVAERAELMDVFTSAWSAKMKSMSRSEKKSLSQLKRTFAVVFMESVYPLLHIKHLHSSHTYDVTHFKARQEQVLSALTTTTVLPTSTAAAARAGSNSKQRLAGIDLLTNPSVLYEPFHTQELTFNPIDERLIANYF